MTANSEVVFIFVAAAVWSPTTISNSRGTGANCRNGGGGGPAVLRHGHESPADRKWGNWNGSRVRLCRDGAGHSTHEQDTGHRTQGVAVLPLAELVTRHPNEALQCLSSLGRPARPRWRKQRVKENNGRVGLQKGNMCIEATEGGKTLNMGASRVQRLADLDWTGLTSRHACGGMAPPDPRTSVSGTAPSKPRVACHHPGSVVGFLQTKGN